MSNLLNSLRRRLARQFGARPDLTKEYLLSQIGRLGDRETVRELLEAVIAEPRDLRRVARRSYIHPNGYDKVVLVSAKSAAVPYELRIHVWRPDSTGEMPDVHNHDWDFASRVLCGELSCEEYAPHPDGEAQERYLYLRSQKGAFEIRYQGMARLRVVRRYTLHAGDTYAMDRMVLHRVRGHSGQITATVILQGPTGHLASEVYRSEAHAGIRPGSSPILPIDPGALTERLRELLSLL